MAGTARTAAHGADGNDKRIAGVTEAHARVPGGAGCFAATVVLVALRRTEWLERYFWTIRRPKGGESGAGPGIGWIVVVGPLDRGFIEVKREHCARGRGAGRLDAANVVLVALQRR